MEYIVAILGFLVITYGIGHEIIKWGGNDYFHRDHENVSECLAIGLVFIAKVVGLVVFIGILVWAVEGIAQ